MTRLYAGSAAAVVIALLGGTAWFAFFGGAEDRSACAQGVVSGAAEIGGPFTLVDGDGQTVTDKEVITGPSLVYFGYTFCPDVCPLDNARNAEAIDILEERGYEVTPVFISIDPARDTPDVVKEFAEVMHPRMIGLTGTAEQVKAASNTYKTYYKAQDSSDEYYLVDHSTFTYLMFPGSGFADFFKRDETAEGVADRVACFIEERGA